jgi:hypothetical protein
MLRKRARYDPSLHVAFDLVVIFAVIATIKHVPSAAGVEI